MNHQKNVGYNYAANWLLPKLSNLRNYLDYES